MFNQTILKILDTEVNSAEKNMKLDAELLAGLDPNSVPILHLYDWEEDSATYGYFIHPDKYLDLDRAKKRKLAFARRPTGGGIVFHTWDLAFSFLLGSGHPSFSHNTLQNYAFVNRVVLEAMKGFLKKKEEMELITVSVIAPDPVTHHFCMARPTQYDVILKGKKIAGAAQRKTKPGYLHQGTISLAMPKEDLLKEVLLFPEVYMSMLKYTYAPLKEDWTKKDLYEARSMMKQKLKENFLKVL